MKKTVTVVLFLFLIFSSSGGAFASPNKNFVQNVKELFKVGRQIAIIIAEDIDTESSVKKFESLLDKRFKISNEIASFLEKDIDNLETRNLDYLIDTLENNTGTEILAFRKLLSDLEIKLLSKILYEEYTKPVLEPRHERISAQLERIDSTPGIEGKILSRNEAKAYAMAGESEYRHWNGHLIIVNYTKTFEENNHIQKLAIVTEYSDDNRSSVISKTRFEIRIRNGKKVFVFLDRKIFTYS